VIVARTRDEGRQYAKRNGLLLEPTVARRWAVVVATRSDVDKIGGWWLDPAEVLWVDAERVNPAVASQVRMRSKGTP
jgi:hypothetical protein